MSWGKLGSIQQTKTQTSALTFHRLLAALLQVLATFGQSSRNLGKHCRFEFLDGGQNFVDLSLKGWVLPPKLVKNQFHRLDKRLSRNEVVARDCVDRVCQTLHFLQCIHRVWVRSRSSLSSFARSSNCRFAGCLCCNVNQILGSLSNAFPIGLHAAGCGLG